MLYLLNILKFLKAELLKEMEFSRDEMVKGQDMRLAAAPVRTIYCA